MGQGGGVTQFPIPDDADLGPLLDAFKAGNSIESERLALRLVNRHPDKADYYKLLASAHQMRMNTILDSCGSKLKDPACVLRWNRQKVKVITACHKGDEIIRLKNPVDITFLAAIVKFLTTVRDPINQTLNASAIIDTQLDYLEAEADFTEIIKRVPSAERPRIEFIDFQLAFRDTTHAIATMKDVLAQPEFFKEDIYVDVLLRLTSLNRLESSPDFIKMLNKVTEKGSLELTYLKSFIFQNLNQPNERLKSLTWLTSNYYAAPKFIPSYDGLDSLEIYNKQLAYERILPTIDSIQFQLALAYSFPLKKDSLIKYLNKAIDVNAKRWYVEYLVTLTEFYPQFLKYRYGVIKKFEVVLGGDVSADLKSEIKTHQDTEQKIKDLYKQKSGKFDLTDLQNLGKWYFAIHDFRNARAVYSTIIPLSGTDEMYFKLAQCEYYLDNFNTANQVLKRMKTTTTESKELEALVYIFRNISQDKVDADFCAKMPGYKTMMSMNPEFSGFYNWLMQLTGCAP